MNIEQERKDFEAWYEKEFPHEPIPIRAAEGYFHRYDNKLWNAYQAGRAARQSQEREDAERYRCLSSLATQQADHLGPIFRIDVRRSPQNLFNFDASVDHARLACGGDHE